MGIESSDFEKPIVEEEGIEAEDGLVERLGEKELEQEKMILDQAGVKGKTIAKAMKLISTLSFANEAEKNLEINKNG